MKVSQVNHSTCLKKKNQSAGYENASAGKECDRSCISSRVNRNNVLTKISTYSGVYAEQETWLLTLSQVTSQMPY